MQARSKSKRAFGKLIKGLLILTVVAVGGYLAYVYMTYHRLPYASEQHSTRTGNPAPVDQTYTALTWNVGYGAFNRDFSAFTDGGTESRARSLQHVFDNLIHCVDRIHAEAADFVLLQEVDRKSDRAWRVDEAEVIRETLGDYQSYYVQNLNSPYLILPVKLPIGAAKSGLLTFANRDIFRAERQSLPVEADWHKLLDLDRCYSVCQIPTDDGRMLSLFNLHFSPRIADEAVPAQQLSMLLEQMKAEYDKGNYAVAGGDFNMDLLGDSGAVFGVDGGDCPWARPIDTGLFPEGITLVDSLDAAHPVPSHRSVDTGYVPGESFVATVDGFIVSDNVEVLNCHVVNEVFECSDHNPVVLRFRLKSPGPAPTPTATPEAADEPDTTDEPDITEAPDATQNPDATEEADR